MRRVIRLKGKEILQAIGYYLDDLDDFRNLNDHDQDLAYCKDADYIATLIRKNFPQEIIPENHHYEYYLELLSRKQAAQLLALPKIDHANFKEKIDELTNAEIKLRAVDSLKDLIRHPDVGGLLLLQTIKVGTAENLRFMLKILGSLINRSKLIKAATKYCTDEEKMNLCLDHNLREIQGAEELPSIHGWSKNEPYEMLIARGEHLQKQLKGADQNTVIELLASTEKIDTETHQKIEAALKAGRELSASYKKRVEQNRTAPSLEIMKLPSQSLQLERFLNDFEKNYAEQSLDWVLKNPAMANSELGRKTLDAQLEVLLKSVGEHYYAIGTLAIFKNDLKSGNDCIPTVEYLQSIREARKLGILNDFYSAHTTMAVPNEWIDAKTLILRGHELAAQVNAKKLTGGK